MVQRILICVQIVYESYAQTGPAVEDPLVGIPLALDRLKAGVRVIGDLLRSVSYHIRSPWLWKLIDLQSTHVAAYQHTYWVAGTTLPSIITV